MSGHQHATVGDTVYFWFGANDTSGSGGDGATPLYDVREAGAAAGAAPLLSGTPTLLTSTSYPDGCYEIAVAATVGNGFAANDTFAVFCTLAIDSQNPTGFVGSCTLTPLAKTSEITALNNLSSADVNAACDTALADYDGPTNAEMEARTLPSADYTVVSDLGVVQTGDSYARIGATGSGLTSLATQSSVDTIDGIVDDILVDTADLQGNQGNWLTATGFATETKQDIIDTNIDLILNRIPTSLSASGNIKSNIKEINDVTLTGTGTVGNEWGP